MDKRILKNFISQEESFTAIIDFNKKIVESLYVNDSSVYNNLTYEEYSNTICKNAEFTDDTKNKLIRFLTNFNSQDDSFSMPITCEYKNNSKGVFITDGVLVDNNKYIISIRKNIESIKNTYDKLTKVYTYNVIKGKIKDEIQKGNKILLMLINIDNFKALNEFYGYMFGDLVLIETAASISRIIGTKGAVGRVAGDQFIAYISIEDTSYEANFHICKDIRNLITYASKSNVKQAKITATLGTVTIPSDTDNYNEAMILVNKALSRGKQKGGNCFVMYTNRCEDEKYNKFVKPKTDAVATSSSNEGKIMTGIFEILNHNGDLKRKIYDSFNLIGTYFQLDRIAIFYNDYKDENNKVEWISPYHPELTYNIDENTNIIDLEELIKEYKSHLDSLGMLKIAQIESNKDLGYVYEDLKRTKTSAALLYELTYMGNSFGLIRFDVTQKNRFWGINDTTPLLIISKILTMMIHKEFERDSFEQLISHDKLTGIYNYSQWRDTVDEYISSNETFPNYAIVAFNILAFSNIVMKHGASLGDEILKSVATAIKMQQENKDYIYSRINDDKFLIFIANKEKDEVTKIIKNIQDYVKKEYPSILIKLLAGASFHNNIETLNKCLDNANIALKYTNATNEIVFYTEDLNKKELHKTEILLHMNEALENNEFLLYLQPKINTLTGEVVGAEALTRWNFNFQKILFPNDFISIFEETGFITELDFNVFERVCEFQRKCIDANYKPIKISVNVSRYQKDFNYYLNRLNEIRNKYNIESKYIEIELTESMYNDNIDEISNFINTLHEQGYYVSMDDFGSGYSNLASLAKLDFDIIKLDKTFCSNMDNSKEQTILSFVMRLVKELDIEVLCEGVETKELIDNLNKLGCFIVQGYYYSKPIPSNEFKEKFMTNNM